MLKKMNEKKNNKGFSLVELIVVILIMAVLAVALAPQVMKWVDNSRKAADIQTRDSVISAVQLAMATNPSIKKTSDTTIITINETAGSWASGNGLSDADKNAITTTLDITKLKTKYAEGANKNTITITVTSSGAVTGTFSLTATETVN